MTIGGHIKKIFEKAGIIIYLKKNDPDYTMLGFRKMHFDIIIDVGANRGHYVKRFNQTFPEAEIYAFEPLPDMFNLLKKVAKSDKIHLFNLALADKGGSGHIYYDSDFPACSSFLKVADYSRRLWKKVGTKPQRTAVKIATLDSIMAGKISVGQKVLIKMDVEGYEEKVIKGGKSVLRRAMACVVEIHFSNWYKGQPTFDEIYSTMKGLGYEYQGNWHQALSLDGSVGYIDAFFVKKDFLRSPQHERFKEKTLSSK